MLNETITSSKTYTATRNGQFLTLIPASSDLSATLTVTGINAVFTDTMNVNSPRKEFHLNVSEKVVVTIAAGSIDVVTNVDDAVWANSAGTSLVKPAGTTVDPADADYASATAAGLIELATAAETSTGTDDLRAVTPADLAAGLPNLAAALTVQSGLTTTGAILNLNPLETTVDANDVLGRITFKAPLEASGTDAILAGASIAALAEAEFTSSVNSTSLLFQTGASEAATTKMVVKSDGKVGIGTTAPASLTEIQGGLTTTGAVLTLGTKETSTVASDVLGRINFYAPLDAAGTDANLVAGSIVAVAEDTFSATVNATSLVFQTGASETATTKMTLTSAGAANVTGSITAHSATAIPANGTAGAGLLVSSTANFGVFFGSGAPSLTAAKGSLYLRSDGSGTGDRMYVNTDAGTTWTAVTTAA